MPKDFLDGINRLPDDDVPTRKCRATICDVDVQEYIVQNGLGDITILFLIFIPSYDVPFAYEMQLSNWSVKGGIEAAFEGLVDDELVDSFEELLGMSFEAEIEYHVRNGQLSAELHLHKVISPPYIKKRQLYC